MSKINDLIKIGKVHVEKLSKEELRQINRQVINTRGELFFSKVVVLFEGETEEQSLPLLVSKHFGYDYVELGVNFIGVGGAGNYLPFIRFCEAFNIEYLIFSDNEPDINTKVLKQISQSKSKDSSKVVFVSTGNDFEKELCEKGYLDEVKLAYHKIELEKCNTDQHKDAKKIELGKISNTDYYEIITKMKTESAPEIAIAILSSSKPLPDKIIELFEKVKNILSPTTHA